MAEEKDIKETAKEKAVEETKTKPSAKAEEPKEESKKQVPVEFAKLVESIEKLSVLELSELVKVLEERFGVSAQATVAVAAPSAGAVEEKVEKSSYNIHLKDAGAQKIQVIKAVKEITGKGLKEAKDLTEATPVDLMCDVKKEDAEEMKRKLEEAGAVVELK